MEKRSPAISGLLTGTHNTTSNFSSLCRLSAGFSPKSSGPMLAIAGTTSCLGLPGGILGLIRSCGQLKSSFTLRGAIISLGEIATNAAVVANSLFALPNRALAVACGVLAHQGRALSGLVIASRVFSSAADLFFGVMLAGIALSSTVSCYEEIKFLCKQVYSAASASRNMPPDRKPLQAAGFKLVKNLITVTLCLAGIAGLIMLTVPTAATAVIPIGLAFVLGASVWLSVLDLQDFFGALKRGEVGRCDQILLLLSSLLCIASIGVMIGLTAGLGLPLLPLAIGLTVCGVWLLTNIAMQLAILVKAQSHN